MNHSIGRGALVTVALLIVGALPFAATPAGATHSFTGDGHIESAEIAGVSTTETEFRISCPEIPDSQGDDAFIFTLPAGFDTTGTTATATGSSATEYDLDFYYYSSGCARVGTDFDPGDDESGTPPPNTRFIVVAAWEGSDINVTLSVVHGGEPTPSPTPSESATPPPGCTTSYPNEPNDRWFHDPGLVNAGGQWGLRKIRAPQAWQEQNGGATGCGIRVAVLDTGIDVGDGSDIHPDLSCASKVDLVAGADFIEDDDDLANDENGHGTHVAGIIGACTNNTIGVAGVAPDSTIVPVRVLDEDGEGNASDLAAAIRHAADSGAHVINMSLGFPSAVAPIELLTPVFPSIDSAMDYARSQGVVVVAAAGNETFPLCANPAISEDVICVGSSDPRDLNSWYGNFPVKHDDDEDVGPGVLAPGGTNTVFFCQQEDEDIISTYLRAGDTCGENGYEALAGTSMAAPHVAGVAALVYEKLGGGRTAANGRLVIDTIIDTAEDLYAPGYDPASGYGRVDALAAVGAAGPVDPPPVENTTLSFTGDVPAAGQFTDAIRLSARLVDSSGNPISGEDVTLQLLGRDGFRERSATTGPDGIASVELVLDAPPGAYEVIAGFAGRTGAYNSSSDRQPFRILREDSAARISVEGNGSKKVITGALVDDDSSYPVRRALLTVYADGSKIGESMTNDAGEVYFSVPPGHRGKRTYEVRFDGNDFFLSTPRARTAERNRRKRERGGRRAPAFALVRRFEDRSGKPASLLSRTKSSCSPSIPRSRDASSARPRRGSRAARRPPRRSGVVVDHSNTVPDVAPPWARRETGVFPRASSAIRYSSSHAEPRHARALWPSGGLGSVPGSPGPRRYD